MIIGAWRSFLDEPPRFNNYRLCIVHKEGVYEAIRSDYSLVCILDHDDFGVRYLFLQIHRIGRWFFYFIFATLDALCHGGVKDNGSCFWLFLAQ